MQELEPELQKNKRLPNPAFKVVEVDVGFVQPGCFFSLHEGVDVDVSRFFHQLTVIYYLAVCLHYGRVVELTVRFIQKHAAVHYLAVC